MISDSEIKQNGIKTLIKNLGLVEAERFIALMSREPFDYTKWRKNLWVGETVHEISKKAMRFHDESKE